MNPFYEAEAHLSFQGQDTAHLRSKDGQIDLTIANPLKSERMENATNPEQLFAAAFIACFENALVFRARQLDINLNQFDVTGKVGIGTEKNQSFYLKVDLKIDLPGLNRDQALTLIEESQSIWPFANLQNDRIQFQIELADRIAPVI